MTDISKDDDDDFLAAEYVLGTLPLIERNALAERARRDPTLAARIADWEQRLSGLNDSYDESPAPDLLPAIEARLFPKPAGRRKQGRLLGFLGFALSAAAILAVAGFLYTGSPRPDLTATLSADASPLRFEAVVTGDKAVLTRVAGSASDAGHSYELWLIKGSDAPRSLGLIGADTLTVTLPASEAGIVLAVSLEPAGGSPTGAPTGPVLAAGKLAPTQGS